MSRAARRSIAALTAASLAIIALGTACSSRGPLPLDQAIPDSLIAASAFRCGAPRLIEGGPDRRVRLAQSLGDALLDIHPVRLTSAEARFLLEEGWAPETPGKDDSDGGLRSTGNRATLRPPGLACDGPEASRARLILALARSEENRQGAGEVIGLRLASDERSISESKLDRDSASAILEGSFTTDGRDRLFEIAADLPGTFALQGIALPLGRVSIEIDHERRDSFVASSMRRASFRIVPPRDAVLRFGIAVASRPTIGPATPRVSHGAEDRRPNDSTSRLDAARDPGEAGGGSWSFLVSVTPAGGAEAMEIFRERIAGAAAGRWLDRRADLSRWAGREITLGLEAAPDAGTTPPPVALWGSPIVEPGNATPADGDARPNILLISIDTLRGDRIGRFDGARPVTPVLNDLAAEGVRFTRCRTQAPSTLYGHAALLTGLPPAAHGATTTSALPDEVPYLPDLLARAGYATAALTDDGLLDGRFGLSRGFDSFRNRFETVEEKVGEALRRIESLPEPWLLFLHTYQVHVPYEPPEDLARAFTAGDGSAFGLSLDARTMIRINNGVVPVQPVDVAHIERLYDAQAARTDAALGSLSDALRSRGMWDRSIVAITSDHGEEFDEHGVVGWHSLHCYDEVARVPLILKLPSPGSGGAGAGKSIGTAVRSIDIAPTLLELAGIDPPPGMWGRSLVPLIHGGKGADRETTCEIEDGRGAMILASGFKYHMRTADSAADPRTFRRRVALRGRYPTEELYDIASDPGEQHDLAASMPERARAMRALLSARLDAARAALAALTRGRTPPTRPREDDEHLRQLRALGYVN